MSMSKAAKARKAEAKRNETLPELPKLPMYDLNEPVAGPRPYAAILARHFGAHKCYPYDCFLWFKDVGIVVWTGPHSGVLKPKGCRDAYSHESREIRQIIHDALNKVTT